MCIVRPYSNTGPQQDQISWSKYHVICLRLTSFRSQSLGEVECVVFVGFPVQESLPHRLSLFSSSLVPASSALLRSSSTHWSSLRAEGGPCSSWGGTSGIRGGKIPPPCWGWILHPTISSRFSGFGSNLRYSGRWVQFCSMIQLFWMDFNPPLTLFCVGGNPFGKVGTVTISVQVLVVAGVSMPQGMYLLELNAVIGWWLQLGKVFPLGVPQQPFWNRQVIFTNPVFPLAAVVPSLWSYFPFSEEAQW